MAATQKMLHKMYGDVDSELLSAKPQYKFQELEHKYPALLKNRTGNFTGSLNLKELRNSHRNPELDEKSDATGYKFNLHAVDNNEEGIENEEGNPDNIIFFQDR